MNQQSMICSKSHTHGPYREMPAKVAPGCCGNQECPANVQNALLEVVPPPLNTTGLEQNLHGNATLVYEICLHFLSVICVRMVVHFAFLTL